MGGTCRYHRRGTSSECTRRSRRRRPGPACRGPSTWRRWARAWPHRRSCGRRPPRAGPRPRRRWPGPWLRSGRVAPADGTAAGGASPGGRSRPRLPRRSPRRSGRGPPGRGRPPTIGRRPGAPRCPRTRPTRAGRVRRGSEAIGRRSSKGQDSRSSGDQDRGARSGPRLQSPVCLRGLGERKPLADGGPNHARLDQLEELVGASPELLGRGRVVGQDGPGGEQRAPSGQVEQADAFHRARGVPEGNHQAPGGQAIQGGDPCVLAHRVVHDRHPGAVGERTDPAGNVLLPVQDHLGGAVRHRRVRLLVAPRGPDQPNPEVAGPLTGDQPHAPGCRVEQERLPGPQFPDLAKEVPDRQALEQQRGGILVGDTVGERHDAVRWIHPGGGVGAHGLAGIRAAVPHTEVSDALPHGVDHAGDFDAKARWEGQRVQAGAVVGVPEVHPDRRVAHADLTGPRLRDLDLLEPEYLRPEEIEIPEPGPGEVRMRHAAIGVNFRDTYDRTGLYRLSLPASLGVEVAGVVDAVGEGVTDLRVGDRAAYAGEPMGAYATAGVYPADRVVPLPDGVTDEDAAAMLLKGLTVWFLFRLVRELRSGDTILFHAAAGGVGLIACQWARHLGVRLIGAAGSRAKAVTAREHGAAEVILYREEDVPTRVRELTGDAGVPVVYDSVGRDTWIASLDSLQPMGLMVSFGNASGPVEGVRLLDLAAREDLLAGAAELFELVRTGVIRATIGQRFALPEAAQAHRALESRATTGSTILIP